MLTAIILVCSTAITPELSDCNRSNAVHVLQLPENANAVMCMLHGQAYLAATVLGRELRADERVKVVCLGGGGRPARAARID
ncbi:MAG: hypothetical protein JO328_10265 [Hyphomicrobiales bacterium]|nr:hypothetical protein [Hyphomicrobiales bacterium]MBV8824944.1 hypothetical protein [Hyphomicrobiales bacterium]MBV9426547.1 hypothetical protein [Bradyrhizobiaceae bacterium]